MAAFRVLFLAIFSATVGVIVAFVLEMKSALAEIPQDQDFVNFTKVSHYLYASKNLICFFVILSYVHLLALMQELPEIGGHVSAILYTITDRRVLVSFISNSKKFVIFVCSCRRF